MKHYDFEYASRALFTTIYPNTTQAAEELSKFMVTNGGSNKILTQQFQQFRADAKAAGYTMGKQRNLSVTDDELLEGLLS